MKVTYNANGMMRVKQQGGFTIVELTVTLGIFSIVALSVLGLYTSLVRSTIVAKRQAVGLSLATNQMEYLKSLPYDDLAIVGTTSAIGVSSPMPATKTEKINGVTYTVTTSINYVDNAFDGCANYPTPAIKLLYCRDYSASTPVTVDTNERDYKVAHVKATDSSGTHLAEVDTIIAARVAETASTTGALYVNVIDDKGNPIPGATVGVANTTLSPNITVSDNTDTNGLAIFYGLPPDSGTDYIVTGSKAAYSTLFTINTFGSLQPTYPNQKIISQQPSYVTLVLKLQGSNSIVLETTDINGVPLANMKVYTKGGYKKYTSTGDTKYYYDTMTPSDARTTSSASGLAALSNLVPGTYIFCGDDGSIDCGINNTKYYLAAAVPYGGSNSLNPIIVPTFDASDSPTTYAFNGQQYVQKVRLMMTTDANFPRVHFLTPDNVSKSTSNLTNFTFTIKGQKLSCGSSGIGCSSDVKFVQNGTNYGAACTGGSGGTQLNCTANISALTIGVAQLVVGTSAGTLTLPADTLLGGLDVGA
jgi:type II secretory pathway pseudopilin PulG